MTNLMQNLELRRGTRSCAVHGANIRDGLESAEVYSKLWNSSHVTPNPLDVIVKNFACQLC